VLLFGGVPLTYDLVRKALRRQFGSDLLAGISIVTSAVLGEYLAGSIVVLMLAGGEALESYALRTASSVLEALAGVCRRLATAVRTARSSTFRSTPSPSVMCCSSPARDLPRRW
jgi:cation transport ATPase